MPKKDTTEVVIYIVGMSNGIPCHADGTWIQEFDESGLIVTPDVASAKVFDNFAEAMHFWKQELPQGVQGFNAGGRPNRPLTAFTVQIHAKGKDPA